ncbi:aldehyde dehydrogenase [Alicyclobacillus sp. SO9]|uniref:aldehyde dehydrogenase family protein n=1 Tax=Alicyclobacillus sp. SO9 TaxID=2665646 RepID=UPI0018E747FE|nr:aldehyde dehydrogenase family protein [Alicyclobacillus sp. SO9]QQE78176.1 aldehyde dehydrogenase family protein [Alicyclobacillus sp. SO9]
MSETVRSYQHFVDGKWIESDSNRRFESVCPADGEVVATVPDGTKTDVDRAVAAARQAFDKDEWSSHLNAPERARLLRAIGEEIRNNVDTLAEMETLDSGKPIIETSVIDIHLAADCFEYFAELTAELGGRQVALPQNALDFTLREPIGVMAAIVPFNFPLLLAAFKVAPMLLAGNTVVLKPSEYTPSTAFELAKIAEEVGVPAGVFNVISGFGPEVGQALAEHEDVDKISFTGSTRTGKSVMTSAAKSLTKVTLELGGKGPNIVFADADLEQALDGAVLGAFMNQGEVCIAGTRILVQDSIYDEFVEAFVRRAKRLPIGHPMDWETRVGSLVHRQQFDKVMHFIESGKSQGAKLLCGGEKVSVEGCPDGAFVAPTVFADVDNSMEIAQEEIFGPVASIIRFHDEDEAVKLANESCYGLAGAVWTENIKRGLRMARKLRLGTVWINQYNRLCVEAPFGGYKQSGMGRELGTEALDDVTQVKNVYVELEDQIITLYE